MRTRTALVLALAGIAAIPHDVAAQDTGSAGPPPARPAAPQPGGVTPEQRDAAIAKACKWLDANLVQLSEFGSPQRQYAEATAGWAYLLLATRKAPGEVPPRGKELDRLADAVGRYEETVLSLYEKDPVAGKDPGGGTDPAGGKDRRHRGKKDGPPDPDQLAAAALPQAVTATQFVWPLSIAAHFHAEAAARNWRAKDARAALGRVVRILESAQQADGGWGHDDAAKTILGSANIQVPMPGGGTRAYPRTFLAASHCALSGLAVAHRALGTKAPPSLDRGRMYFTAAQERDGTFPYDPSQTMKLPAAEVDAIAAGAGPSWSMYRARTAGAAYALTCAGAPPADPVLAKALRAIEGRTPELSEGHGSATLAVQYAAMLALTRGPEAWAEFRAEFFPRILAAQAADGSFDCVCRRTSGAVSCDTHPGSAMLDGDAAFSRGARGYVTAIHVLVLAMDAEIPRALPRDATAGPTTPR